MSSKMKQRLEPSTAVTEPEATPPPRDEEILRQPGSELMIRRMSDPVPIEPMIRDRNRIIEYNSEHSAVVQSFRTMRTLLLQQARAQASAGNFITLVTAIRPGSGTSFVARNLAAALAFDEGRTALLIDCNREAPSVDALLNGRAQYGLTDLLENPGSVSVGDIIYSTGIPRLRAIPVGRRRERPVEYFTTHRMKAFLEVARRRYRDRYLIVDAPAMDASADARILADWCQYVVLVVRYGEITRDELLQAVATFPREKFVGVIFNDYDPPPVVTDDGAASGRTERAG